MAVFCVRVPDDVAARFDAAAAARGGRSAGLRRLIEHAAAAPAAATLPSTGRRDGARLMVRLTTAEARHVAAEAAAMSVPRSGWVAALVRRHAAGQPRFSRSGELELIAIHGELRRVGVNINQIARALNTAVMEGRVLDTELTAIDDLRRELRDHVGALGEAFAGNLAYWEVGP